MNYKTLKIELDDLYSKLNPPFGVVPEWAESGMSAAELDAVEKRLDIKLPADMKQAMLEFSGISHETPYYLDEKLSNIKNLISDLTDGELVVDEGFSEEIEIQQFFSPRNWGGVDLNELRVIDGESFLEVEKNEIVAIDFDVQDFKNKKFLMVGTLNDQSLYVNLIDNSKNYGAFYKVSAYAYSPFFLIHKMANNYDNFLMQIKKSLLIKINSEI